MKVNLGKYRRKDDSRKVNVEIEKFDTYSLDHTLALIILPALIQLKLNKQGVPASFADYGSNNISSQQVFDFYEEAHDWAFEENAKKWDEVLDKMIWSFQQLALEDYESQYHHGNAKYDWVKTDDQLKNPMTGKTEELLQMVDTNPTEHWYDHNGHLEHEKRIQEGLDLFGKYYRNLWD